MAQLGNGDAVDDGVEAPVAAAAQAMASSPGRGRLQGRHPGEGRQLGVAREGGMAAEDTRKGASGKGRYAGHLSQWSVDLAVRLDLFGERVDIAHQPQQVGGMAAYRSFQFPAQSTVPGAGGKPFQSHEGALGEERWRTPLVLTVLLPDHSPLGCPASLRATAT